MNVDQLIREHFISKHRGKKYIIWGTGGAYRNFSNLFEKNNIKYFVDNASDKWGSGIDGKEIRNPESLKAERKDEVVIFIMSIYTKDIIAQLETYGFSMDSIVTFEEMENSKLRFIREERLNCFKSEPRGLLELFEQFKSVFFDYNYKSISLGKVMMVPYCYLLNYLFIPEFSIGFPHYPFRKIPYGFHGDGHVVVSYFISYRPDHRNLVRSMFQDFSEHEVVWLEHAEPLNNKDEYFINDSFKYKSTFEACETKLEDSEFYQRDLEQIQLLGLEFNQAELHYLLYHLNYYRQLIDFFEILLDKVTNKIYIATLDTAPEECIITQLMQKKNIPTLTLQHGLSVSLELPHKRQFDAIELMYHYIVADEIIVWGQHTVDYYIRKGVPKERIHCLGNPKYNFNRDDKNSLRQKREKRATGIFAVFFMNPGFKEIEINMKLIDLANFISLNTNMRYILKLHPGIQWAKYSSKELKGCTRVVRNEILTMDLLEQVDFSIMFNTTAIIEATTNYYPVLRYRDENVPDFITFDTLLDFKDTKELLEKIDYLQAHSDAAFIQDEMERLSEYFFSITDRRPSLRYKELIVERLSSNV